MYCELTILQNTPDPRKPAGYILRSNIIDIIDIFEVNRKECARLLLEYPKWTLPGTFKARPGAPLQPEVADKNWELDNTIVEVCCSWTWHVNPAHSRTVDHSRLQFHFARVDSQGCLLYCLDHGVV